MLVNELSQVTSSPIMPISGVTGEGITEMLRALLENVESVRHTERVVQDQETLAPEEEDANPKEWSPV